MARKALLFACCLLLLSAGLLYASLLLAGMREQPRHEEPAVVTAAPAPAGQVLACLASLDVALPPGAKFLRAERSQARPVAYWALVQIPPDQVGGIEQSLRAFADRSSGRWTLVEDTDLDSAARLGPAPPEWWTPHGVADARGLLLRRHGGLFAVLSRQTGQVYLMVF